MKVSEREALQVKSELVSAQLTRAEVLTSSLADEQVKKRGCITNVKFRSGMQSNSYVD